MYIWRNIKCCVKFRRSELHFHLASHVNFRYDFFAPCKVLLLKYGYKIAVRVLCQSVSTISTCYFHLEQLIHYTLFMLWNYHALEWMQTRHKNLFCFKAPQMWNQLPADLRTIESFSCFKMELKQYFMMTRSRRNCFNWCYSSVILVYCLFICICLSQVMLENGLSSQFT